MRNDATASVLETQLGLDYMRQKRALDALEAVGVVVVDKFKKVLAGTGNARGARRIRGTCRAP